LLVLIDIHVTIHIVKTQCLCDWIKMRSCTKCGNLKGAYLIIKNGVQTPYCSECIKDFKGAIMDNPYFWNYENFEVECKPTPLKK
jgi:hypothetical protein